MVLNPMHDTTPRHAPAGEVMIPRNHGPQGVKVVYGALVERGLCRQRPGLSLDVGHAGGAVNGRRGMRYTTCVSHQQIRYSSEIRIHTLRGRSPSYPDGNPAHVCAYFSASSRLLQR